MTTASFEGWLGELWRALGGDQARTRGVSLSGPRHVLPSLYDVTGLSVGGVAAAALAVAELHGLRRGVETPAVELGSEEAALAFRCELYLQPLGWALPPVWDRLAGVYRTREGFIRLHTNYAHHRDAALRVLGTDAEREAVATAVARWSAEQLEAAVVRAGGCAAAMRGPGEWRAHPQGAAVVQKPLVRRQPSASGTGPPGWATATPGDRPLSGIRVLDLTRVIAGPLATRWLAAYGAEVLRLDPPGFEEVGALIPETTVGKRRARLDLRAPSGRAVFDQLLGDADVLVHGYRTEALARLGYDRERLRADYPELIVTQHNAYGFEGPWRDRRGFDSLVQMSCGIAARGMEVGASDAPRPLPAQALDHATGYLLAAATCRALSERLVHGRVVYSRLSLARTAHALMSHGEVGRLDIPEPAAEVVARYLERADSDLGPLRRVRVPGRIEGVAARYAVPAGSLGSHPARF
jgi:crotonobetainyl-CoA:carnitine CoA-transferase CaiB-like acyl-CoA transferase